MVEKPHPLTLYLMFLKKIHNPATEGQTKEAVAQESRGNMYRKPVASENGIQGLRTAGKGCCDEDRDQSQRG